jgi:hypothetical protein
MTDENVTNLFANGKADPGQGIDEAAEALGEALNAEDELFAEEEFVQERAEFPPNKVGVGFHPLGGLGITISDYDGETKTARLTPPEVYQLVGNLTSLVGIVMMEGYMQQIAAQQEAAQLQEQVTRGGIVLPGGPGVRR